MKNIVIILNLLLFPIFCFGKDVDSLIFQSKHFEIIIVKDNLNNDSIDVKFTIINTSNEIFGMDTRVEEDFLNKNLGVHMYRDITFTFEMMYKSFKPKQSFTIGYKVPSSYESAELTFEFILDYPSFPYRLLNEKRDFKIDFTNESMDIKIHSGDLPHDNFGVLQISNIDLVRFNEGTVKVEEKLKK